MPLFGGKRNQEPEWPKYTKVITSKNPEFEHLISVMWHSYGIHVEEMQKDATSSPVYFIRRHSEGISSEQYQKVSEQLRGLHHHGTLDVPKLNSKGQVTGWAGGLYNSKTDAVSIGLQVYHTLLTSIENKQHLDDENF